MTTRFKNAIDALVYAFFNDTLAKGTCAACAVGNIVAHAWGKKVGKDLEHVYNDGIGNGSWTSAFVSLRSGEKVFDEEEFSNPSVLACIIPTGYSVAEMAMVELAFEGNTQLFFDEPGPSKEEFMQDQYNGLMAVVDVLCEIEGIEDPTEYKELFAYS